MSAGMPLKADHSRATYIDTVGMYRCACGKRIFILIGTIPCASKDKWIIDSIHREFVFIREFVGADRSAKTIAYDFVESTNLQFERYQDSVPELANCEWVTKWD